MSAEPSRPILVAADRRRLTSARRSTSQACGGPSSQTTSASSSRGNAPVALANEIGKCHPALATSELGLEEQPATRLQAQPAGDVDADVHSESETDLYRWALRMYERRRCPSTARRRAPGRTGASEI